MKVKFGLLRYRHGQVSSELFLFFLYGRYLLVCDANQSCFVLSVYGIQHDAVSFLAIPMLFAKGRRLCAMWWYEELVKCHEFTLARNFCIGSRYDLLVFKYFIMLKSLFGKTLQYTATIFGTLNVFVISLISVFGKNSYKQLKLLSKEFTGWNILIAD